MTLSETLMAYKTRNNLSSTEIARKLQISRPQVCNIENGSKTTLQTVKKMIDNLGPEFEPFLEYLTCKCGAKFIPKTYNQNCCSDECSWKYNGKSRKKLEPKTLQQKLNQYIEKYYLSGAETARRIGIGPTQVSEIRLHNKYSPVIAEKIYKAFGDEFKEFVEYDTCPYCGSQYVRRTSIQRTCLSGECVRRKQADNAKEYERKVNSGEYVKRSYEERRPKKKKYLVSPDVKPKVSYAEYNERARSQGLSYGQLQGLERLGLR